MIIILFIKYYNDKLNKNAYNYYSETVNGISSRKISFDYDISFLICATGNAWKGCILVQCQSMYSTLCKVYELVPTAGWSVTAKSGIEIEVNNTSDYNLRLGIIHI